MEEPRDPKQASSYPQGLNPDFSTFSQDATAGYHGYSHWTQFSGIPSGNNPAAYHWDPAFQGSPPSTPGSAGISIDPSNPYFGPYNDLNMMNGMGRTSPLNFDADPRQADSAMLASTPLAQSLIEASLNSPNPLLTPLPDGTFPIPPPESQDFQDASQNGYEIYAEALKKLENFPSYNPFGTNDVLNSSSTPPTPPVEQDTSNLKPSYSDVAKTLKGNQNTGTDRGDNENFKKRNTDSASPRSFKSNKKYGARPIRGRNNSVPDDMRSTVSPDSKYGLDAFEDLGSSKLEKDIETPKTLDSLPPLIRKNSTSSVSSGTSGIEEIHLPKTCNIGNANEESPNLGKAKNSTEKANTFDGNLKDNIDNVKPFFDARRIFQSKDTNKNRSSTKGIDEKCGSTILNNGKPASWCTTTSHKKTNYINNNLRDSQKKTNQNPVGTSGKSGSENMFAHTNSRPEKSRMRNSSSKSDTSPSAKAGVPVQTSFDQELIDEWLSFLYDKGKLCLRQLWTLILMVVLLIFSIIVYLVSGCVHILSWIWSRICHFVEVKVLKGKFLGSQKWKNKSSNASKKIGLDENIALPATGDEAMQRLLACKGKDPYSILGLKSSATDEDIRRYYKRQAVLVHPDKNQQPGAEEAFKILGHAFDLIGETSKRSTYDRQLQEASEAEAAMREFNDLLTKLQEKIQQANNMMRCDNCGGKHKRIPVERPWYSARFCDRCSIRHSAKEGDVWAETSMLGFLWHYYACMEGKIYDITEWVACKKDFFKHMQANAHHVFYRIATEGNRGHHHGRSGGSGEADLEDFISNLFHQAMQTDGTTSQNYQQSQQTANGQAWTSASHPAGNTAGKRNRRKKKKH